MANGERKLTSSSLIPLEIDPVSILSLSKGVIFDTIVHNIDYTLNNRRTDALPWKLIGMSLICDSTRNKKYMQKLQKMQCVPSVICTQIYHSKLIKTESGVLTTPGRKITLATTPRQRLTGIIVCRSIDELLHMESSSTENVHFIQYKLLSYGRIATRELVNGPKLASVGDKVIKTVFDFELTQNNGFPRQLLPVAIISFGRQDGCDLALSIRNFLKLDEHKTFDKSYLVTSINVELDRLREEQEKREDTEIEQELVAEKIQRRQPLADLSRKSTDTSNASSVSTPLPSLRVPPLKIRLSRPEKATVPLPLVDTIFRCLLKLDRVNLSLYDISNLPSSPPWKPKKTNEFSSPSHPVNNPIKAITITKPYEHHKPLKRLQTSGTKKQPPLSTELSKNKRPNDAVSTSSLPSDPILSLPKKKLDRSLTSTSSRSPAYRPKSAVQKPTVEKTVVKKKVERPVLSPNYHCSLALTRIDLSIYNIDLPSTITSDKPIPMDTESLVSSSSPFSSISFEPTNASTDAEKHSTPTSSVSEAGQGTMHEREEENTSQPPTSPETNVEENLPQIVEEFATPDLNELELNDILPETTDVPSLSVTNAVQSTSLNETVSEVISEMVTETTNEVLPTANEKDPSEVINEVEPSISNEEVAQSVSSPVQYTNSSPDLPPLDDDPVVFDVESPSILSANTSDLIPQDYIIIVPCSDDEDDLQEYPLNATKTNAMNQVTETKPSESSSSSLKNTTSYPFINPALTRIFTNSNHLKSRRLSTSSSSSYSSISTSILHNQSPCSPLHLTEILIPSKILRKKQRRLAETITFSLSDFPIPIINREPLIDPRLIYRLQSITTDLRWTNNCTQCSTSSHLPSRFIHSTQTISYDQKYPSDFLDPRRQSLKSTILTNLYQRIKLLLPHLFIIPSNQLEKLLFEQTIFITNCSLHLEYLLYKLKRSDDLTFFQLIKTNDELQLSPFLLQSIFT